MLIRELFEDGRIVNGVNTTVDVGVDQISIEAEKLGFNVSKDGVPPLLGEAHHMKNPKNTFLTKADTAYDFLRVGKTISNLDSAGKDANRDEPDVMIVPFGGKKEKDHLKKGLKKAGYKTQDADKDGDDSHVDEAVGQDCPPATQDLELNTKNRDATLKNFNYGPLNVSEPGDYWEKIADYWDTDVEAALASKCGNCVAFDISERMDACMPGETSDDDGRLGYCWMHHFKCHSARSCHTWAKGGPIEDDVKSLDWQKRGEDKVKENFADGKKKGKSRPGRVKKSGASCNGTVTQLRKRAKNASGEKAKMYHWCANMKSGRKKK